MKALELPSRPCVRVVVVKLDKICLLKQTNSEGKFTNYAFPGGGIEPDQDHFEAVKMECLEEVGIAVTNVTALNLIDERRGQFFYGERAKRYAGIKDNYYIAQFLRDDRRLFNSQGDGYKYEWLTIPDAVLKIQNGPVGEFNSMRIKALELAAKYLSEKNPAKPYRW